MKTLGIILYLSRVHGVRTDIKFPPFFSTSLQGGKKITCMNKTILGKLFTKFNGRISDFLIVSPLIIKTDLGSETNLLNSY